MGLSLRPTFVIVRRMSFAATLYTTDHCALCDTAFEWLQRCDGLRGLHLRTIDVAGDDVLLAQYGDRVPVLAIANGTLDWPFTDAGVRALMDAASE